MYDYYMICKTKSEICLNADTISETHSGHPKL